MKDAKATVERFPHLSKAPIVEALIEIRVQLPPQTTLKDVEAVGMQLATDYPDKVRDVYHGDVELRLGAELVAGVKQQQQIGFAFSSRDRRNVFQALLVAFAFSRLKPYETWDRLRSETLRVWKVYRDACQPIRITRIGVRYINRLLLPSPVRDLNDFLTTGPHLPPRLPQEFAAYLIRYMIRDDPTGAYAMVTQHHEPLNRADAEFIPVLLDVDAFHEETLDPHSDSEIEKGLDGLRNLKNRVFFESITEKAVNLWQ